MIMFCYTSSFVQILDHRSFQVELHPVFSIFYYTPSYPSNHSEKVLYSIQHRLLYRFLTLVVSRLSYTPSFLYPIYHSHCMALFYLTSLYSIYHRLFKITLGGVKVLYPVKPRLYSVYHGLYPIQPRQKYIQFTYVYIELQARFNNSNDFKNSVLTSDILYQHFCTTFCLFGEQS